MLEKKNILIKISIIFIFFSYFLIGLSIHKDYGINWDEQASRNYGFISGDYVLEKILPENMYDKIFNEITNNKFKEKIAEKKAPKLTDKNFTERAYGVTFELPAALLETILNINEKNDVYKFRHLLVFLVFFVSIIFFYKLCFLITKKTLISLLFTSLLVLHPRIFANSFYNSKDLVFLSYSIISIFYGFKILNKDTFKNFFLFSFSTALAFGLKIIGIFILYSFSMIYLFKKNFTFKKKILNIIVFSSLTLIFTYILWPYLWESPIFNFISAIELFTNYTWFSEIPFGGKIITSDNLPWNYIPIFFIISTPFYILVIILFGLAIYIFQIVIFIKKREFRLILENFFILQIFLIPLFFSIINKSTLYDGWRHFFFMYPILLIVVINSFNSSKFLGEKLYEKILIIFIVLGSLTQTIWNYKNHPFQNNYFNKLFYDKPNSLFESDYWGISNKYLIDEMLKYKKEGKIYYKYETSNFKLSLDILDKKTKERFIEYDDTTQTKEYFLFILKRFKNFDEKTFQNLRENNKIISEVQVDGVIINGLYKIELN